MSVYKKKLVEIRDRLAKGCDLDDFRCIVLCLLDLAEKFLKEYEEFEKTRIEIRLISDSEVNENLKKMRDACPIGDLV